MLDSDSTNKFVIQSLGKLMNPKMMLNNSQTLLQASSNIIECVS